MHGDRFSKKSGSIGKIKPAQSNIQQVSAIDAWLSRLERREKYSVSLSRVLCLPFF
jgi:hypothetical protein